jgi:hypothetical protein
MTHVVLSDLSIHIIDEMVSGSFGLFHGSLEQCEEFVTNYPNYPEELDPRDWAEIDDFGNEI